MNPAFDDELLARSLHEATSDTWVYDDGTVRGHLYGALLANDLHGDGVWIGPDGVSFDDPDVLEALYSEAGARWIERGAIEHYVWTLDVEASTRPWYELGFARMHLRGVMALHERDERALAPNYSLRRGGPQDIDAAVALDDELDAAQRLGPSFSIGLNHATKREELLETLLDSEVHHYVVESDGEVVAQCLTFPLPQRRGSFEHTLHLSAVSVRASHRGRGVASAMVDHALANARRADFAFVETNWRVTNRRAQRFWRAYGFEPTYVRLHRTIGAG